MKLFLLLAIGFISPQLLAEESLCIQKNNRVEICPHVMIRSIKTDSIKFKNKAICICLTDFKDDIEKWPKLEQKQILEMRLIQAQQKYEITREDLLKLIHGD